MIILKRINFLYIIFFVNCLFASLTAQTIDNINQLQTIMNSATAGDVITIKDGVYDDSFFLTISKSGTLGNPITLKSESIGGVIFTGTMGINITGNYVVLSGFTLKGTTVHQISPISSEPTAITLTGSNNLIERIEFREIKQNTSIKNSKGITAPCRYLMFINQKAKNNTISRCAFIKGTEHSIMIIGYINNGIDSTENIIENSYFKGTTRHSENGNSAIRFGSGKRDYEPQGKNIVRYNLFEEYHGEEETISLKSSGNTVQHNTFLNCYGQINARHYHDNKIIHNYFIKTITNSNILNGGTVGVWGENHSISNNYFHEVKSRDYDGGSIELIAGISDAFNSIHEQVKGTEIKSNIFYNPNSNDAAIAFNARSASDRKLIPIDTKIIDNYIYSTSNVKMIDYNGFSTIKSNNEVTYSGNKINKNTGDSDLTAEDPKLVSYIINGYTIYKPSDQNIGPSSRPLRASEVGPNSAINIVAVTNIDIPYDNYSIPFGDKLSLSAAIIPTTASNQAFNWHSSDPTIAKVNFYTGEVTAIKVGGPVTVTVNSEYDSNINDSCTINVTKVEVTGIAASSNSITLQPKDTQRLTVAITPSTATDKSVTWSSSNSNIVTVNSNGLITGVNIGTATIRVTSSKVNIFNDITVNVTNSLENVALNKTVLSVSDEQNTPGDPTKTNLGPDCIDGDTTTRWAAENFPQHIIIDLSSAKNISKTELISWNDRAYQFEISTKENLADDFVVLVDAKSNTTAGSESSPITHNFERKTARYIKLEVFGVALGITSKWVNIRELRVFGTSATTAGVDVVKNLQKINTYPNPFKNTITINTEKQEGNKEIILLNLTGAIIHKVKTNESGKIKLDLSNKNIAKGIYFLKIIHKNSSKTIKLIKE